MSSDFLPTTSNDAIIARAKLLAQLRRFFDTRDFCEVQTPLLSHDTVIDQHLDPLAVTLYPDPQHPSQGPQLFLQTSPEFAMKRMLCAGLPRIYQITHAFRAAEVGAQHNPEFTMLEWYRVGDDYAAGMQLLADLAELLFARPCQKLTYRQAFQNFAGLDPYSPQAKALGEAKLDEILSLQVQPKLGFSPDGKPAPLILHDYPADQAALARVSPATAESPAVAERFELFAGGVELANGYHELLDANILSQRNQKNNAARMADGKPSLPVESRLLQAMQHGLPASSGTALGVDRLLMVLLQKQSIEEVIAFPIDRA